MKFKPKGLSFLRILGILLINVLKFASPDALTGPNEGSPPPTVLIKPNLIGQNAQSDLYPYNVTISNLTPNSVDVSWNCRGQNIHDKYEVTLKPLEASYRVVETVPYNTCSIKLERLDPSTSYQVSVVAISGKFRKRSSSLIFRTYAESDMDYDQIAEDVWNADATTTASATSTLGNKDRLKLPRVRMVEIGLVGMALVLWAGAIVLFFHRWGKIRMLLPYQPDYKEMKRNNSVCANCSMTPHHQCCRVHQLAYAGSEFVGPLMPAVAMTLPTKTEFVTVPVTTTADTGCSPIRPRLNSFVVYDVVSNEKRKEGSPGVPRKSKSAENLEHYSSFSEEAESGGHDVACTEF